jgi:hypothetical protein
VSTTVDFATILSRATAWIAGRGQKSQQRWHSGQ